MERVASKKLDKVLVHQKSFSDKSGLRYTGKSSSSTNMSKEMKFVKAKEPMVAIPSVENVKVEKKTNGTTQKVLTKPQNPFVAKPKAKGKSLPKSQRSPQIQHFCHHYRIRGHTRPNCYKLHALKKMDSQRSGREVDPCIGDVMNMIHTITSCLETSTKGLRITTQVPNPSRISPQMHVPCG